MPKASSVRVKEDTLSELHELKFDLRRETMDEVLKYLIKHFREHERDFD